MEIILSKQCESLSGSLGSGFGYCIQKRTDQDGKTRFWGVRNTKGPIPADGHWRFIVACANLAHMGSHIDDIIVSVRELDLAIMEATEYKIRIPYCYEPQMLNAEQVLSLKEYLRL